MSASGRSGPLDGVRVLELTQAVSGPFCGQLLADYGADVIKIEPPGGEIGRRVGPFPDDATDGTAGGMFQNLNRNKRSVILDIRSAAGAEALLRLVDTADVVIENFAAGVLERRGLGADALRARNPRLIYASIRGFGDTTGGASPYLQWPAFDLTAQAMGGVMAITGTPESGPMRSGAAIGDTVPGLYTALGIVLALSARERTGTGQVVDVAMADGILSLAEVAVNQYAHRGHVSGPGGNSLPGVAPFDRFTASDGHVTICAPLQAQWERLCAIMGRPDLAHAEGFGDDASRAANHDAVLEVVDAWTRAHTVAELTSLLGGVIPFGPVYRADQLFTDPHFAARDMLPELERPDGGRTRVTGVVAKLSATPGSVRTRAPRPGEHTEEVLEAAGFTADEVAALRPTGPR